jgi:hypothetical protein
MGAMGQQSPAVIHSRYKHWSVLVTGASVAGVGEAADGALVGTGAGVAGVSVARPVRKFMRYLVW